MDASGKGLVNHTYWYPFLCSSMTCITNPHRFPNISEWLFIEVQNCASSWNILVKAEAHVAHLQDISLLQRDGAPDIVVLDSLIKVVREILHRQDPQISWQTNQTWVRAASSDEETKHKLAYDKCCGWTNKRRFAYIGAPYDRWVLGVWLWHNDPLSAICTIWQVLIPVYMSFIWWALSVLIGSASRTLATLTLGHNSTLGQLCLKSKHCPLHVIRYACPIFVHLRHNEHLILCYIINAPTYAALMPVGSA